MSTGQFPRAFPKSEFSPAGQASTWLPLGVRFNERDAQSGNVKIIFRRVSVLFRRAHAYVIHAVNDQSIPCRGIPARRTDGYVFHGPDVQWQFDERTGRDWKSHLALPRQLGPACKVAPFVGHVDSRDRDPFSSKRFLRSFPTDWSFCTPRLIDVVACSGRNLHYSFAHRRCVTSASEFDVDSSSFSLWTSMFRRIFCSVFLYWLWDFIRVSRKRSSVQFNCSINWSNLSFKCC